MLQLMSLQALIMAHLFTHLVYLPYFILSKCQSIINISILYKLCFYLPVTLNITGSALTVSSVGKAIFTILSEQDRIEMFCLG